MIDTTEGVWMDLECPPTEGRSGPGTVDWATVWGKDYYSRCSISAGTMVFTEPCGP